MPLYCPSDSPEVAGEGLARIMRRREAFLARAGRFAAPDWPYLSEGRDCCPEAWVWMELAVSWPQSEGFGC